MKPKDIDFVRQSIESHPEEDELLFDFSEEDEEENYYSSGQELSNNPFASILNSGTFTSL